MRKIAAILVFLTTLASHNVHAGICGSTIHSRNSWWRRILGSGGTNIFGGQTDLRGMINGQYAEFQMKQIEEEARRTAIALMAAGGFDPWAMASVWQKQLDGLKADKWTGQGEISAMEDVVASIRKTLVEMGFSENPIKPIHHTKSLLESLRRTLARVSQQSQDTAN